MRCKFTNKKIKPFMTFGKMPIANGFLKKKDFKKEFFYELKVGFSEEIGLFQINDHPKPKQMFHKNYPFYTSSSKSMIKHFANYANWLKKFITEDSRIIEIGSNDGTLLKNFEKISNAVGFEPSKNVSDFAKKRGVNSINLFFNSSSIKKIKSFHKKTDLICAANVICHIPNIKDVFLSISKLLSKNGVFVFEEPYLGSVIEKTSYDQIYDEHIFLFSALSVSKMAEKFDLRLIDAIPQKTHGGSMRYVVSNKKNIRKVSRRLKLILKNEKKQNLHNIKSCEKFKKNCLKLKEKLKNKLSKIKKEGKRICGYAATSKSTTILNYCNIGPDLIDFITDTTKEKIGKFSPGMHIPIIDHKFFVKKNPDVAVLFAWNHKKEIVDKEKKFRVKKGKWLTFFPQIKVW